MVIHMKSKHLMTHSDNVWIRGDEDQIDPLSEHLWCSQPDEVLMRFTGFSLSHKDLDVLGLRASFVTD